MIVDIVNLAAKVLVVAAFGYASTVAITAWAVRNRHLNPFGGWPRLVRKMSDPVVRPLERRVVRFGGNPQDAPLWLIVLVIALGLLLLSFVHWLIGFAFSMAALSQSGPRVWLRFLIGGAFTILMVALFVRVIASWFGVSPHTRWMRPFAALTDWLLEPIRRFLPPMGVLDFSPMVAWLVLWILRGVLMGLL